MGDEKLLSTWADVLEGRARWAVERGDCRELLATLPDACLDSAVTDPPYGLGTREPTVDEIVAYLRGERLDTGGDFMGRRCHASADGTEEVDAYNCIDGCPVRALDEQSAAGGMHGAGHATDGAHIKNVDPIGYGGGITGHSFRLGDSGGASRFLYCAKPSTAERELGCEHLPRRAAAALTDSNEGPARLNSPRTGAGRTSTGRANHHPTVKSIDLMRWLCRLVTPPGGIILDPFAGSGTTGCAAALEHLRFIGCDLDLDDEGNEAGYVAIARARIAYWAASGEARQQPLFAAAPGWRAP